MMSPKVENDEATMSPKVEKDEEATISPKVEEHEDLDPRTDQEKRKATMSPEPEHAEAMMEPKRAKLEQDEDLAPQTDQEAWEENAEDDLVSEQSSGYSDIPPFDDPDDFAGAKMPAICAELDPEHEEPLWNGKWIHGSKWRIFQMFFEESQKIMAVRCPMPEVKFGGQPVPPDNKTVRLPAFISSDDKINMVTRVQHEAMILKKLAAEGFKWCPKFYGADLTFTNPLKCPYIVTSWINGNPLLVAGANQPRIIRDSAITDLAAINLDLIERTAGPGVNTYSPLMGACATAYFEMKIRERHLDTIRSPTPANAAFRSEDLKDRLPMVLFPELDDTPFAIQHGNLKDGHVIIDNQNNVVG